MTALIIISSIFAFIFLLLIVPLRAHVVFKEEFTLVIRYLFLKFQIVPSKEDEPEEKAKKPAEEEKPEGMGGRLKAFFKREGMKGFLNFTGDVVKLLGGTLKRVLKHARIRYFDLYICIGGEDAADIAELYGQACAVVYPAYSLLFSIARPRRKNAVTIDADFTGVSSTVSFESKINISPLFLLAAGLRALLKALPLVRRFNGPRPARPENPEVKKENSEKIPEM